MLRRTLIFVTVGCILAGSMSLAAESLRAQLLAIPVTSKLGGDTTRPVATKDAFTFIAGNATEAHKPIFARGNAAFIAKWDPAPGGKPAFDGLGPLFNRTSCLDCHIDNGRGEPPAGPDVVLDSSLVRVSIPGFDPNGGPNPVPIYGDQIQDRGILDVPPEATPQITWSETQHTYADGTPFSLRRPTITLANPGYGPFPENMMTSLRMSNPVIGLGLLEAIPESTLLALADVDDADNDGISGRPNIVFDLATKTKQVGRFGWKANMASLAHQNATAALSDMGVSSDMLPIDLCRKEQVACVKAARAAKPAEGVEMSAEVSADLLTYMRLVAVPQQRNPHLADVKRGEGVFRQMGCAACHIPTLITADNASLPEIASQTIHPFTDLLLHDMGEGLSDQRPDTLATGREWRTPPLWGLGLTQKVNAHTFLLHDGRARNIAEAILWHGGEAETAKENFRTAPKATRDDLLAFLNSL